VGACALAPRVALSRPGAQTKVRTRQAAVSARASIELVVVVGKRVHWSRDGRRLGRDRDGGGDGGGG